MIKYKPKVNEIENKTGDILATKYYHKIFPNGENAIPNENIQDVDEKNWEIFTISSETEDAYYGMPLEGLGTFDCMILKSDTRPFLQEELDAWNDVNMGMYGSHSGNLSYTFKVNIKQGYSLL